MKSLLLAALATLAVASLAPSMGAACSCMRVPPETALAEHDAVFEGRVVSVEPEGDRLRVRFEVVQQWKGVTTETVELRTANNSAACGVAFEADTSWLVYADAEEGGYVTGLCSRTARMSDAEEDREFLGAGEVPVEIGEDDEVEPAAEHQAPARGGCASCAVSDPRPAPWPAMLALGAALVWRRSRRRAA